MPLETSKKAFAPYAPIRLTSQQKLPFGHLLNRIVYKMVRKERLELSQVTPLEPKSSASTSSATFANRVEYFNTGVNDGTRTCYPRLRRPMLYPNELRAQYVVAYNLNWSGWRDSNSRHPAPKAGALPGCATPRQTAPRTVPK